MWFFDKNYLYVVSGLEICNEAYFKHKISTSIKKLIVTSKIKVELAIF